MADKSSMPGQLKQYWVHGKGAALIGWGTDGDFNKCVTAITEATDGKVSQRVIKGICSNLHREATGTNPGQH